MRIHKTLIGTAATTTAVLCVGIAGSSSAAAATTPATPSDNGRASVANSIQAVGLPYTFTASGLSGGNGVQTPVFSANASGGLCVDPNLDTTKDATGGSRYNNEDFRVEIWQDNSISDSKRYTFQFTGTSQPKKCATGFKTNQNHYAKIIKNVFIDGHLMGGNGVISY